MSYASILELPFQILHEEAIWIPYYPITLNPLPVSLLILLGLVLSNCLLLVFLPDVRWKRVESATELWYLIPGVSPEACCFAISYFPKVVVLYQHVMLLARIPYEGAFCVENKSYKLLLWSVICVFSCPDCGPRFVSVGEPLPP